MPRKVMAASTIIDRHHSDCFSDNSSRDGLNSENDNKVHSFLRFPMHLFAMDVSLHEVTWGYLVRSMTDNTLGYGLSSNVVNCFFLMLVFLWLDIILGLAFFFVRSLTFSKSIDKQFASVTIYKIRSPAFLGFLRNHSWCALGRDLSSFCTTM